MDPSSLTPDCARCAALCCLSLSFERSNQFAIDKSAGIPCPRLGARHDCSIHADRARHGFAGCISYDCGGAGQRVTLEVFGGRSWQDDRSLVQPMMEAFWVLREVHEAWRLLELAGRWHRSGRLQLSPEQALRRQALEQALQPVPGGARAVIAAFERELATEVKAFLASLRTARTPDDARLRARRRLPMVAVKRVRHADIERERRDVERSPEKRC